MSPAIILSEISRVLDTPISLLDLNASFIHNGGDSLSSIQLQAGLRKHGIRISFESIFAASALQVLADKAPVYTPRDIKHAIAQTQRAGLKRVHLDTDDLSVKRIRRDSVALLATEEQQPCAKCPMTEMQLSLVRSTQMNPGRNVISYYEEHKPEAVPAVKLAWKAIMNTEPIFNLSFEVGETEGHMYEGGPGRFAWEEINVYDEGCYLRMLKAEPQHAKITEAQVRVVTLQSSKVRSKSTIIYSFHHALIDGVSFSLLLSKVKKCLRGETYTPGPSYTSFALQLKLLQEREHESAVQFWRTQKKKYPSATTRLLLPGRPDGIQRETKGLEQVEVESSPEQLVQHARKLGVTVASLYYAAWGLVLSRYTDSDQVCFGAVLSGRTLPIEGVETVIGPTINTLPFSLRLSHHNLIREYISETFAELLGLTTYQWSTPNHGFVRNFDSAVNVRFHGPNSTLGSLSDSVGCPYGVVYSDIPIHIEVGDCGKITMSYHADSFARHHMACLGASFATALKAIMNPDSTLNLCLKSFITTDQLSELGKLGNWASKRSTHAHSRDTLVSLFSRSAESNPAETAIEWRSGTMTYSELHEQSSHLAKSLAVHVVPGDVVCVDADRSISWIVAIYAVLKAGATYFPLEKNVPDIIRDTNYKSAGAKLFLTARPATKSRMPASCNLCLSVEELLLENNTSDLSTKTPHPKSNAYICFTSGSTGNPKGVLCRHDGLVAFQNDFSVRLCSRSGWRIAQFMSPAFDGSIHEIFSTLSYGATLVLQDESQPLDHLKKADSVILTPSVAQILEPSDYPNLKAVYLVGEAVPQSVCDIWAEHKQLFNMYGPTEATCGATIKRLKVGEPVSLGSATPSSRIYILDSKQSIVPPGVIGEIYLAGVQVAHGYVGRPRETSTRFFPDSVCPEHFGEFMYKTGDRAYWSDSGELMLLGRNDRQIKLRGFRIDLDDLGIRIERAHEDCTGAAVAVNDDELVAFVQPASLNMQSFRASLSQHIPPYALPRRIKAVKAFPMTPAGKLDYRYISNSDIIDEPRNGQSIATSEKMVLACLREVLGMTMDAETHLDSNVDDVCATSIVLISLAHRLSQSFKRKISVRLILGSPSFRDLASALAALQHPNDIATQTSLGDHGVSPIEKDWWYKYQVNSTTSPFNVSYSCDFPRTMEQQRLVSAWDTILSRHRILSSRYTNGISRSYSEVPPTVKQVQHIDIPKEVNDPFDLKVDDLIRVLLSPTKMLVVVSHIICDLTTLRKVLQEVADVYHGITLAPVAKAYSHHAWSVPAPLENLSFWRNYLSNPSLSDFSVGKNTPRKQWGGSSYVCEIPQSLYNSLLRFSSARKVTMHQLALASVALALQHKETLCDITIGAPYLNRNSEDDLEVVGLFLEPLPIRIQYPQVENNLSDSEHSDSSLGTELKQLSFIKSVQRSSRAALSHAVPWDQLLSHLGIKPDYPNHPLFDAMVTFHDLDHDLGLPIDGVTSDDTWAEGSKFKIMAEFTASRKGCLKLRLEYSDECFSCEDVRHMQRLIVAALGGLMEGKDYDEIVRVLRSVQISQKES
ncbi:uncharacterized protein N0V89_001739 [Didymosphaeria variabile]|uniref:Carrier domain-containing protein n=1 Tax=Didymosphaeria variabile TaxID=1932322 RepID=A0A9W8XRF9_9PLEO|nr:uncharacterized protein N0V89_001739 [Didymosphaeria variabile]KAJ4357164.1 hypothetical protein N0V89_001739 [Didymosphaeria variabile]